MLGLLTWGLLHFTYIAFKEMQIWNTIFGCSGFLCALFGLVYGFIKLIS